MPSLYDDLGVTPKASEDEIKRAFRKLALKHHPDKNPDNPLAVQEFIRLTKAYNVSASRRKLWRLGATSSSASASFWRIHSNVVEILSPNNYLAALVISNLLGLFLIA